MKITNLTQAQQPGAKPVKDAGGAEQVGREEARKQATGAPETGDKVELSRLGKDVSRAAEIVKATPEVRADKVAALKAKIESGNYEVDSKKVASKMIIDSLERLT